MFCRGWDLNQGPFGLELRAWGRAGTAGEARIPGEVLNELVALLIRFSFLQKPFGLEVKVWEGMGRLEKRLDCWRGSENGILDIRSLSTKLFSK